MRKSPRSMRSRSLLLLEGFEPRWLLAATKVVFTTAAITEAAGTAASAITVQLQDSSGNAAPAGAGGQAIGLSTSSSAGTFFDAGNNAVSSIAIPAGSSTATFTYVDTVAAGPVLTASAGSLTAAQQTETVTANAATKLAFASLPSGDLANTASTSITITLLDANNNVAVAPTGGSVIALSSTSAGGTFSSGASVTIAAGSSSTTFTYKDSVVGTPTITATSSGLSSASQAQTIYSATTVAVKPDPAGLGSYASTPPGGQNAPETYGTVYDWINRPANSPLPTNDWWTLILKSGFAGSLYSLPQKLFTASYGVNVSGFTGISSVSNNIGYAGEQAITVGGNATTFNRDALVDYGDWSLRFRMEKASNQYVDVTSVQGSPMTWFEYANISPVLTFGAAGTYGNISDSTGASLGNGSAGFTTDHFRFTKGGVTFGVFAPPGTVFVPGTNGFNVAFAGASHYLVVGVLPDQTSATFDNFYQHAYSVPRSTTYGYSYSAVAGAVTTTWNVATETLKAGASTDIIQGWLPTNYRDINSGPAIVSGYTWPTIYGTIKTSIGHSFTIVQPTAGLNFVMPAPQPTGAASEFDPSKMQAWLSAYQLGTGADSYGGQTTLSQAAELTLMAKQLNSPDYTRLLNILRGGVTDWLTYQAGDSKFYTLYPKDGGLIAYPPAFGSDHYTDLHFHLGYLTSSAAVLAMLDPTWATNYGAIATMVAKTYANWDRSDTSEPYLRTFNPWAGHSYADGLGDSLGNQGNDQESASEAVQSWQGLVLLGSVLNNQAMLDAGMMGYTMETKAETEYWLNVAHQDLNPVGFPANRNTAINADFTRESQTFFGGNPKYQLGIEGLPDWPSMDFLGKYTNAMQAEIDATLAAISTTDPYGVLGSTDDGNDWLGTILGIQGQVTPQKAADQFARLGTLNAADNANPINGIPYYLTQSSRTYGLRDYSLHLSLPVGGVYLSSTTGTHTYIVYNAAATAQTVQVLNAAGTVVDSFNAAPRTTTVFSPFAVISGGVLTLNGTPISDSFTISQVGSTITAALGLSSQTFDATTLNSIVINGFASDDTLDYNGGVTLPLTFNGGTGEDTLNVNAGTFTFAADANGSTQHLSVNVADSAAVVFNSTQHIEALSLAGNAVLSAGGNKTLVVQGFATAGNGKLDLADNSMIVDYAGATPFATIQSYLHSGYAGGAWNGHGISSSTAAATVARDLGYAEATDLFSTFPATFANQSIDSTSVLITYTIAGDANLDRKVDFDDLVRLAQNYGQTFKGWSSGDFDYDGAVNFNDLVILAQSYGASLLPPALVATRAEVKTRKSVASTLL